MFLRDAILHTLEFDVDSGDPLVTHSLRSAYQQLPLSLSGGPFKYCKNMVPVVMLTVSAGQANWINPAGTY